MRCSECNYEVCNECLPLEIEEDVIRREIHEKKRETYELKQDIVFYGTQERRNTTLTSIYLDPSVSKRSENEVLTQLVICGEYLCWKAPNEPIISVCSIKKLRSCSDYDFYPIYLSVYDHLFKTIDLTRFIGQSTMDGN